MKPPFREDSTIERYQPGHPLGPLAMGGLAVAAGLAIGLSSPHLVQRALGGLANWSIRYARTHPNVARFRGPFWISQAVSRVARVQRGGLLYEDVREILFRQEVFSALDTVARAHVTDDRLRAQFLGLADYLLGTRGAVRALMRESPAEVLRALGQSEFLEFRRRLARMGIANQERLLTDLSARISGALLTASEMAGKLPMDAAARTIRELARQDILRGSRPSILLRPFLSRAGYRQMTLEELFQAGLWATSAEDAEALREAFVAGHRLDLSRVTRQSVEETFQGRARAVLSSNIYTMYRHLESMLGSEHVLPITSRQGTIIGWQLTEQGLQMLRSTVATGMFVSQAGNELLDLSYVMPAIRDIFNRFSNAIGLPLSPFLASMNPMRLFPWYRPMDQWFQDIGYTAHQVGLSAVLGLKPGQRLGVPVYMIGGRAFALDVPGIGQEGEVALRALPHRWKLLGIRGESMERMVASLTQAGASGVDDRPALLRWLDIGAQQEQSWWNKLGLVMRSLRGEYEPSDPMYAVQLLRKVNPQQMDALATAEYSGALYSLYQFFSASETFDELAIARGFGRAIRQQFDPERFSTLHAWGALLEEIGNTGDYERAIAYFRHGLGKEQSTMGVRVLSALVHGDAAEPLLMDLGYVQNPLLAVNQIEPFTTHLSRLLEMRGYLYSWMSEYRTPYRLSGLLDPVSEVAFGQPNAVPNVRYLLRALMLEPLGYAASIENSEMLSTLVQMFERVAQEQAGPAGGLWAMLSLYHESLQSFSPDLTRYVLRSFSQRISPDTPTGAYLDEFLRRYRRWYHVPPAGDYDEYGRIGTRVLAVRSYEEIESPWQRYVQYAKDWANFFFTGNPESLNAAGLQSYFFAWRLNEMLQNYGLGLSARHLGSPFSIYSNLFLRRVLPIWLGVEAWKYVNSLSEETVDTSPASLIADAWERIHVGLTWLQDVTGLTSVKKALVASVPGLDRYFTPRSAKELEEHYRYGFSTVRRGRGWLVASRTPLAGEAVEAYVAPWTRAARSHWQAARNVETSGLAYFARGDSPLPTPHQPLAPLVYLYRRLTGARERSWMERHRFDRPYPGVSYYLDDRPPFRAPVDRSLVPSSDATPGSPAAVLTAMLGRYTASDRVEQVRGRRWFYVGPGFAYAGPSQRVAWARAQAAGEAARWGEAMGMPGVYGASGGGGVAPGVVTISDLSSGYGRSGTTQAITELSGRLGLLATAGEYKHELHGLYGWFTSSALGLRRGKVSLDYPDWAISFSRRLWETRIGGLDILPWQSELNEFYRRWFHRRKASDVRINPIPNNMPIWLPERFWYGDPYTKIPMGELRLPGEAYRRLNPAGFTKPLMSMRASMLGAKEEEILAYLTGLEGEPEETEATQYGELVHKELQRYLKRLGLAVGEEVFVYDPEHNISGHIDLIVRTASGARRIVEIKTVGENRWDELGQYGIEKHYIQLQQYMHTTGIHEGGLLYINRDDPTKVRYIPAGYDPAALERAWSRLERVRSFLLEMVESGRLHEGYLYPDLVKFEILSDVAPKSREWYAMRRRVLATAEQMTEEERARFESAQKRAEEASKRYVTTPYRNVPLEVREGTLVGVTPSGRLLVETPQGDVVRLKLAGIEWSRSGLQQFGGSETPLSDRVVRFLEYLDIRKGGPVRYLASERLGSVENMGRPYGRAILLDRYGRWVNRIALREGVAKEDESDQSDEARRLRQSPVERAVNAVGDWFAHLDTPLHTKLLKVRSPLEEWKRSFVFGTIAGDWFSPVSSYLLPALRTVALSAGPVAAAFKMGGLASLFALSRGGKLRAFGYGAAAGLFLNLMGYVTGLHGQPPPSVRRRWEVEQYMDLLEYLKYRRLYEQERELAKEEEGFDIDRLLESTGKQERWLRELRIRFRQEQAQEVAAAGERARRLQQRLAREGRRRSLQRLHRDLSRSQRERFAHRRRGAQSGSVITMSLGEHAKRALLYREMYLSTAFGAADDERSLRRLLRTVPARYRQLYQEILETGSRRERREFFRLIPEYQQRLFARWLDPDHLPIPRQDPTRLLARYGLPGPHWRGWRPDVDIRPLIAPLLRREGLDPTAAAVFPGQQAIGEELARLVGLPRRNVSRRQVLDTLGALFRGRDGAQVLHSMVSGAPTDSVHISLQVQEDTDQDVLSQLLDEYVRYG